MQNRWKKAGCIRRLPYSQSCQPRNVAWIRSPAASCVRPAASRAAFTCAGVGLLAALPARLRFGWLDILSADARHQGIDGCDLIAAVRRVAQKLRQIGQQRFCFGGGLLAGGGIQGNHATAEDGREVVEFDFTGDCTHFNLLAPVPEARCKRSVYDSKYTRIAYKCKMFLKIFPRAQNKPSNAKVSGGGTPSAGLTG